MKADVAREPIDLVHESDFSLGSLRVRPPSREVIGNTGTEVLEPRVMQVFVTLARRRGEVVSRDELVAECWGGRVVGDDAISRCIVRLRRLSETQGSFTVETIARSGYRLTESASADSAELESVKLQSTLVLGASANADSLPAQPTATRYKWAIGASAALLLVVALFVVVSPRQATSERRERQAAILAEVISLVQKDQYTKAFTLARPLRDDDWVKSQPDFLKAWKQIVVPMRPLVAEDGATVYSKSYEDVDGEWVKIGVSPISQMTEAPLGTLRFKIEKPGFRTGYFAVANPGPSLVAEHPSQTFINQRGSATPLPLVAENAIPKNMVAVPRTNVPVWLTGWTTSRQGEFRFDIPAFAIARFEVSNQEFKEFIDAGGYDNPAFWSGLKFEDEGRELSYVDARKRFVDSTHRPGPAEWQLSTYPAGKEAFPVAGISWYEAVAYARFRGESLPTIHHWLRAGFAPIDPRYNTSPAVALMSTFLKDGPSLAHQETGLGPWGTYHTAGNVREWVSNFAGKQAVALGGMWSDYASEVRTIYSAPPMQRDPTIGFRLMKTAEGSPIADELLKPIALVRDVAKQVRNPVSDDAFEAMRFQFSTAHVKPISVTVEQVRETPIWIAEEVTLKFPGEHIATLYVFRPKTHSKPLQPIIFSPAATCCVNKRPNRDTFEQLKFSEFIVNSGRALIMPIWIGSYERFLQPEFDENVGLDRQRRFAFEWQQDLSTTLDYLAMRNDIDMGDVGYLGISRGVNSAQTLAIEPRVKAAVLVSGGVGVNYAPAHPMLDIVNYAPRITIPVLLINGRFDHLFPYEQSQKRLFDLLGTPANQKSHSLYDAGHYQYPINSLALDASNWFDKYLGEVRK